jgi:hypothetical protein
LEFHPALRFAAFAGMLSGAASAAAAATRGALHTRNAERLLAMARANGGCYLKIAQHGAGEVPPGCARRRSRDTDAFFGSLDVCA